MKGKPKKSTVIRVFKYKESDDNVYLKIPGEIPPEATVKTGVKGCKLSAEDIVDVYMRGDRFVGLCGQACAACNHKFKKNNLEGNCVAYKK